MSTVWFGFYQYLLGFTLHKTQGTRGLYTSGRHTYIHLYIGNKYSSYSMKMSNAVSIYTVYTVKPLLRGHLWDKEKVTIYYKASDLLQEVQFINNVLWQNKKK